MQMDVRVFGRGAVEHRADEMRIELLEPLHQQRRNLAQASSRLAVAFAAEQSSR